MNDIFSSIKDNSIVIMPKSFHNDFLHYKKQNPFLNVKLMDKNEVLKCRFGQLSDKALLYLVEEKKYSYEYAKTIIENLQFVENKTYQSSKNDLLAKIKTDLIEKGLYRFNPYQNFVFKGKNVYIYGYSCDDKELNNALKFFSIAPNYISLPSNNSNRLDCFCFESVDNELNFVFDKVCYLLQNGISVNDIYFYGASLEYEYPLTKFSQFYGIKVESLYKKPLQNDQLVKEYLSDLKSLGSKKTIEKYKLSGDEPIQKVLGVTLQYINDNLSEEKILFYVEKDILNLFERSKEYDNQIKILQSPYSTTNAHIFCLGFSLGKYPYISKDDEYLQDIDKSELNMLTSIEKNYISKEEIISFLKLKNIESITFKENSLGNTFNISTLSEELNMRIIYDYHLPYSFSLPILALYESSLLDLNRKYLFNHPYLATLKKSLEVPYLKYDYSFSKVDAINPDSIIKYSYSSLKNFFECQFKYYLTSVLKVDEFESNFYTKLGSLAHKVLEMSYNSDFDFEKSFESAKNEQSFDEKEEVLLIRLKVELKKIIYFLNNHSQHMRKVKILKETKISTSINKNVILEGFIDKIVISENESGRFLSLVDYKTGRQDFKLGEVEFGYSLQLPIYLFLISSDERFKEFEPIGIYLQKIFSSTLTNLEQDIGNASFDEYKLVGLSIDDKDKLATFDDTFTKSQFIKSMATTLDTNFARYSKVASKDDFVKLSKLAKEKVLEADQKIRQNDFVINPKAINNAPSACEECKFKDICYRQESAIVKISTKEAKDGEVD